MNKRWTVLEETYGTVHIFLALQTRVCLYKANWAKVELLQVFVTNEFIGFDCSLALEELLG